MTVLGKPMERMQWMKMCLIRTALKAIAELAHALQQQVEQHACALNHSFRIIQNMTAQFNFDREFASSYGMTYEGSANTRSRDCGCAAGDVEEVEANQDVPSIEETARLFIRNLPYGATEADLAEAFREHGSISEVHLVLDRWVAAWTLTLASLHAEELTRHPDGNAPE